MELFNLFIAYINSPIDVDGISVGVYWSSSESSGNASEALGSRGQADGDNEPVASPHPKNNVNRVRPVRAF